jgi:hypothetical protein
MCAQKTKAAENQASGQTGFEFYQSQLALQAEKTHNQLIELLERLENQHQPKVRQGNMIREAKSSGMPVSGQHRYLHYHCHLQHHLHHHHHHHHLLETQ